MAIWVINFDSLGCWCAFNTPPNFSLGKARNTYTSIDWAKLSTKNALPIWLGFWASLLINFTNGCSVCSFRVTIKNLADLPISYCVCRHKNLSTALCNRSGCQLDWPKMPLTYFGWHKWHQSSDVCQHWHFVCSGLSHKTRQYPPPLKCELCFYSKFYRAFGQKDMARWTVAK